MMVRPLPHSFNKDWWNKQPRSKMLQEAIGYVNLQMLEYVYDNLLSYAMLHKQLEEIGGLSALVKYLDRINKVLEDDEKRALFMEIVKSEVKE